jgi:hypothetical protein
MIPNQDFLSEKGQHKKVNTKKQQEYKPSKEELTRFSVYYSLNTYQRSCLASTNYFRVLYGENEIAVPDNDLNYHKYFDRKCYELAAQYQKTSKMDTVFSPKKNFSGEIKKLEVLTKKTENKEVTKKQEITKTVPVEVKVEQVIVESKPIVTETIVEEKVIVAPEPIKVEPVKIEPIKVDSVKKEVKVKSAKKDVIKKSDDSQGSLF